MRKPSSRPGLAKNAKLASQMLGRLFSRGLIAHPRHGVFTPLPKRRKDQQTPGDEDLKISRARQDVKI